MDKSIKVGRGTRTLQTLVGFAGCMCDTCGRVLPHRVARQNPPKQVQPIKGDEAHEEGLWLEVWKCPYCKTNAMVSGAEEK